jgi:hypothetical protein
MRRREAFTPPYGASFRVTILAGTLRIMTANIIWWVCIALETTLLVRGIFSALVKKYRLFYGYITCVLAGEVIRLIFYLAVPDRYASVYWYTELATIIASYAVVIEILQHSLRPYPGLSRSLTRLLWIIFALTVSYACCDLFANRSVSLSRVALDLGRDLRFVQGALLLTMLWFFGRHRVSLGRNSGGITIGSAMWIGANVINLAFLSLEMQEFSPFLRELLPITYSITLAVWCISLWSAAPAPASGLATAPEEHLAMMNIKIRTTVVGISDRFLKVLRQR